jgi:iron(III) transport system substrate-binding protein
MNTFTLRNTSAPPTRRLRRAIAAAVLCTIVAPILLFTTPSAHAQSKELNLYSARHYGSDLELYAEFTKQTGIKVNQIQAGDEAILERLKSEGKASPADVILLVDAARLWKAQIEGLFQPLESTVLEAALPKNMRASDLWFGLTTRARLIVYDRTKIKPEQIQNYEDLASPALKGQVCTRSGSHPYMLSLVASIVAHQGEAKAQAWANGVVANLARTPRGGDTDQITGVMSGECGAALTNSYYLVRLLKSPKAEERESAVKLGVIWPNQSTWGTHINVSGGGVARYAPHPENAKRFIEFLSSPMAQAHLANTNNEWPAARNIAIANLELSRLGSFKADTISISAIADQQPTAARVIDRARWK